jgi:hypothetical protein
MEHILSKGLDSLSLQDVEGVTPHLSEHVIASQLNQLSTDERNFVLQDIHGVADLVEETPEFVQDSIGKLQQELEVILLKDQQNNPQNPSAYAQSVQQYLVRHQQLHQHRSESSPSSLSGTCSPMDSDFLLSFLRADQFNVPKAAERIVRYFQEKRYLFGSENLTHEIRMDHFDEETLQVLQGGRMQLLPARDSAGRAVLLGVRKLQSELRDETSLVRYLPLYDLSSVVPCKILTSFCTVLFGKLRSFFYLGSVTAMDEETQRKGVVIVHYCLGKGYASRSIIHGLGKILRALPIRVASIHICENNAAVKAAASIASLLIGSSNSVRVRGHCGTDMEVQYELMTFGLKINFPSEFPISPSGAVDLREHTCFLERRRIQEEVEGDITGGDTGGRITSSLCAILHDPISSLKDVMPDSRYSTGDQGSNFDKPSHIIVPGELDIILGRGRSYQNYKGNLRYRHIVESHRQQYEMLSTKKEKTQLIKDVVEAIHVGGGRFLQQDLVGRWTPVDIDMARNKVSHSFRNQKRLSKMKTNETVAGANIHQKSDAAEKRERDLKRVRDIYEKL